MIHKHIHRHKNKMKLIKKSNSNFEKYGLKSLHILDNNISNPRYPGFSEFISSSSLRNSSYCWSLGRAPRASLNSYKKYNDNIYNIPDFKSTRFTNLGYGSRKDLRPTPGKGDPSPDAYKIYSLFENNLRHKKGPILGQRLLYERKDSKFKPGPGAYNSKDNEKYGTLPIMMKFRHSFFYDEDIRQKKATVSMQKYSPKYNYVERKRFNGITFGYGDRPRMYALNNYPGPAAYKIPSIFDRGYKGKLPLN